MSRSRIARKINKWKMRRIFREQKREWLRQGGEITKDYIILTDYHDNAGQVGGDYFHQDLLVARFIFEDNPKRHMDVGSRIDGFVAHVASFREIEVIDIRPAQTSRHHNILFVQADLTKVDLSNETDSLSCLHAIEHFGLGRYFDPVDVNGHIKGIDRLVSIVKPNGRLYLSCPIGQQDEVHFNAHRILHPNTILAVPSIRDNMELIRFDYVDGQGDLHCEASVQDAIDHIGYGCGIYTFTKRAL